MTKAGPTHPEDKGVGVGLTTLPIKKTVTKASTTRNQNTHLGREGSPSRRLMTQCSESRKEAARLTPLLTPRTLARLATWNIRTMYETGQTIQAAREVKNYKIRVLGLSETRWLQSGQLKLSSGEQILYSGHIEEGAPHTEGVALMLAPEAHGALIGWDPVNSRIITDKFTTKKKDIRLNIIQCYALTNDAEEEKNDDFYQKLQAVIDRSGAKDISILMGDFNAKINIDNTRYEDIMGTNGLGQKNENGEGFADLCALNQLVIGGSIFPHRRIHKATWISPNHITKNKIDHICISRKFRRSWQDVRVMRGDDGSSDHHLLMTTVRLLLKRFTNANGTQTKYNVGLLRDEDTQAAFQVSLSNRFQPLQELIEDDETDIETQW